MTSERIRAVVIILLSLATASSTPTPTPSKAVVQAPTPSRAIASAPAMGSCTGRLVASPEGIRYDTTDRNDAFGQPLSSLERLDVDYLVKTLHVKIVKGRQYDFTDPDGNADRLFVFQRDVDAARKKLSEKP